MRNLTIKRTKSFVGCIVKLQVYLEDHENNQITINNIPCRKLGTLKNGEEATFQIGNNEARVYVIADIISKEYCNDFYLVPAGEEDISLSGKNHFNISTGNAFLFDGANHSEDDLQLRNGAISRTQKEAKRRGRIIMFSAIALGVIIGLLPFLFSKPEPKTFTSSEGISITLTDEFKRQTHDGFTDVYSTSDIGVMIFKEGFYEYFDISGYSSTEYGYGFLDANDLTGSEIKQIDSLTTFEYTEASSNKEYGYFAVVYKDDDAFWVVQFSCDIEDMDENKPTFIEWAKSVKFD